MLTVILYRRQLKTIAVREIPVRMEVYALS